MRNCSDHLERQVVTNHLQYFVNRMQYSGYPQEYRYEVMSRAFKIHNTPREGTTIRRRRSKAEKRNNWYDQTKFDGVMFVDVTPNSEMKNRIQDACRKNKVKVKVVEKMNRTIKNTLQRSNPFGWKHCGRGDCPTCNRDIHINCRTRGVVYEIECKRCKETVTKQYTGQTGRSVYERMREHFHEWEIASEDSYLQKHSTEYHNGDNYDVDVRILTQCLSLIHI